MAIWVCDLSEQPIAQFPKIKQYFFAQYSTTRTQNAYFRPRSLAASRGRSSLVQDAVSSRILKLFALPSLQSVQGVATNGWLSSNQKTLEEPPEVVGRWRISYYAQPHCENEPFQNETKQKSVACVPAAGGRKIESVRISVEPFTTAKFTFYYDLKCTTASGAYTTEPGIVYVDPFQDTNGLGVQLLAANVVGLELK